MIFHFKNGHLKGREWKHTILLVLGTLAFGTIFINAMPKDEPAFIIISLMALLAAFFWFDPLRLSRKAHDEAAALQSAEITADSVIFTSIKNTVQSYPLTGCAFKKIASGPGLGPGELRLGVSCQGGRESVLFLGRESPETERFFQALDRARSRYASVFEKGGGSKPESEAPLYRLPVNTLSRHPFAPVALELTKEALLVHRRDGSVTAYGYSEYLLVVHLQRDNPDAVAVYRHGNMEEVDRVMPLCGEAALEQFGKQLDAIKRQSIMEGLRPEL